MTPTEIGRAMKEQCRCCGAWVVIRQPHGYPEAYEQDGKEHVCRINTTTVRKPPEKLDNFYED